MAIKFAGDIVKEIKERGSIVVPEGYVTGEAFEEWLHKEEIFVDMSDSIDISEKDVIMPISVRLNFFLENYGEAA